MESFQLSKGGVIMEKESLDFTETLQTKLDLLQGAQEIVLSTSLNNHITSRVVFKLLSDTTPSLDRSQEFS